MQYNADAMSCRIWVRSQLYARWVHEDLVPNSVVEIRLWCGISVAMLFSVAVRFSWGTAPEVVHCRKP